MLYLLLASASNRNSQGQKHFAEPKRNVLSSLHQRLIWRATYWAPVEPLSNLKLGKYPRKKWQLSRTSQVAARLLRQGTKKNDSWRTTLMQHEDFAGCSQATPVSHEEKWDPRVRHSWSTARFQGRGVKSWPLIDLGHFFISADDAPISAFKLYRDFCALGRK